MMEPILLSTIVDALDGMVDDGWTCLDAKRGEVVYVRDEVFAALEDDPEAGPRYVWESAEEYEIAKAIEDGSERYIQLPTRFDINEWGIMRSFAESLENGSLSAELYDAIHGRGAFRMFKATIRRHGAEQAWYAFRKQALAEIAAAWLNENEIPYRNDLNSGV